MVENQSSDLVMQLGFDILQGMSRTMLVEKMGLATV
jgi:hypothetical protein